MPGEELLECHRAVIAGGHRVSARAEPVADPARDRCRHDSLTAGRGCEVQLHPISDVFGLRPAEIWASSWQSLRGDANELLRHFAATDGLEPEALRDDGHRWFAAGLEHLEKQVVELRGAQDGPGQPGFLDQLFGSMLGLVVGNRNLVAADDRDVGDVGGGAGLGSCDQVAVPRTSTVARRSFGLDAQWMTPSTPVSAAASPSPLARSARRSWHFGKSSGREWRLDRTLTSFAEEVNCCTICLPRVPVPPVTRMCMAATIGGGFRGRWQAVGRVRLWHVPGRVACRGSSGWGTWAVDYLIADDRLMRGDEDARLPRQTSRPAMILHDHGRLSVRALPHLGRGQGKYTLRYLAHRRAVHRDPGPWWGHVSSGGKLHWIHHRATVSVVSDARRIVLEGTGSSRGMFGADYAVILVWIDDSTLHMAVNDYGDGDSMGEGKDIPDPQRLLTWLIDDRFLGEWDRFVSYCDSNGVAVALVAAGRAFDPVWRGIRLEWEGDSLYARGHGDAEGWCRIVDHHVLLLALVRDRCEGRNAWARLRRLLEDAGCQPIDCWRGYV